jgi:hypothetical protein
MTTTILSFSKDDEGKLVVTMHEDVIRSMKDFSELLEMIDWIKNESQEKGVEKGKKR